MSQLTFVKRMTCWMGALSLTGLAACATDVDPDLVQEEATAPVVASEEPEPVGSVSESLRIGGGGTGASCGFPPLHCSGKDRGVYPGCDAYCGPGETSMCLPGSCFWHRGPVCSCQSAVFSPQ